MADLTMNEYQKKAMSTCLPESDNLFYMLANLVGEVGEFASKAGKHMRKGKLYITPTERDEGGHIRHPGMERYRRGAQVDAFGNRRYSLADRRIGSCNGCVARRGGGREPYQTCFSKAT